MRRRRVSPNGAPSTRQRGVTILEALVASVLLAVGIMGLAGVQTRSLIETRATNARATAVMLSRDLAERITTTLMAARDWPSGSGATLSETISEFSTLRFGEQRAETAACLSGAVPCTPAQLARSQLVRWRAEVAELLPNGDAATFAASDPERIGVMLAWADQVTQVNRPAVGAPNPLRVAAPQLDCPAGRICHLMWLPVR
ncbi:MAG: type pilus modification protein PilV [Pseudomonadota bacterium]|jgi:type IV pilus assembly protein PilV